MSELVERQETMPAKTQTPTPMHMIQIAMEQGADVEKLEKLMALHERYEQNEAKKAYIDAMARFKSEAPKLTKNKHVAFGKTEYDHATLDHVVSEISRAMSPLGLSFNWHTEQGDGGQIRVTCIITHVMGHSEQTSLVAGADQSGGKNNIQAVGSTVTYLQRYTLLAATGLAVSGQDSDSIAPGEVLTITDAELNTITDMILATESDEAKLLKFVGAPSLEGMTIAQYRKAMSALQAKQNQGGAK